MMRLAGAAWVAVAAALAGCGPNDRERDCAEVRAILAEVDPVPRRYRNEVALRDERPFDKLKKLDYRDAEVKQAVLEMVTATGVAFFLPNTDGEPDAMAAYERVAKLCKLPATPR